MCKLSAVWLLLISSHWESRSASWVDTRMSEQIPDCKQKEYITEERRTLDNTERFIRKSHKFTASDLQKVREILEPLLTNASEATIAFTFPVLEAAGVHSTDWTICDKGHCRPSNSWSKSCSECSRENLLKQHGLVIGGACGGNGYGRGQGQDHGRGRGQFQFNEGSKHDRGKGPRGRGKGRALGRSYRLKKEDNLKSDIPEYSKESREKNDKKSARESFERNGKVRGGNERQRDKINESVTNGENKTGRERGESGIGIRGRHNRGSGRKRGGGSKGERCEDIGKEHGKMSEEGQRRGNLEQLDGIGKTSHACVNVAGRDKRGESGRDCRSEGKGGMVRKGSGGNEGSRDVKVKGTVGKEVEGVLGKRGHGNKSRGGQGGGRARGRGGGGGGSKGECVGMNKEVRDKGEHSKGSKEDPYRGEHSRGSKVESGEAEAGKLNKEKSGAWNGAERGGGRGRGRGRGNRGGRGRGNRGARR